MFFNVCFSAEIRLLRVLMRQDSYFCSCFQFKHSLRFFTYFQHLLQQNFQSQSSLRHTSVIDEASKKQQPQNTPRHPRVLTDYSLRDICFIYLLSLVFLLYSLWSPVVTGTPGRWRQEEKKWMGANLAVGTAKCFV